MPRGLPGGMLVAGIDLHIMLQVDCHFADLRAKDKKDMNYVQPQCFYWSPFKYYYAHFIWSEIGYRFLW